MTKLVLDPGAFIRGGPRQVPVQPMLALGIVVVLAIAFSAAVVCTAIAASRDSNQIGTVLESFLEATSRGDFVSAYEYFSAVQKDEMSEGRFKAEFGADAAYAGFADLEQIALSEQGMALRGLRERTYLGRVMYEDGSTANLKASLVLQGSKWKIDSIGIGRAILD